MTITRTLTSPAANGLDLRLDYGTVKVVVGTVHCVEVHLSTQDADDSPAAKAIRAATIDTRAVTPSTGNGREVARREDGYARVVIPDQKGGGGSVAGITFLPGGGIHATNVSGGMQIIGNRVYVNGQEVTPGGTVQHGIEAEVRLPATADLRVDTDGATVTHVGGPLNRVVYTSVSGSLNVAVCAAVKAKTVSGACRVRKTPVVDWSTTSGLLEAEEAEQVRARSVSGRLTVHRLAGDAELDSTSGHIEVTAVTDGRVEAVTVSGRITVEDPFNLYEQGRLSVRTSSVSGRVSAPGAKRGRAW